MRFTTGNRIFVIILRTAAAFALPACLYFLCATLFSGCSYANQQAGEVDARPVFPKIIFDSNVQIGKQK